MKITQSLIFGLLLARLAAAADQPVVLTMTVNARTGCGPAKLDFVRVLPEGSASTDVFRVPAGKLLVVTDVDWTYNGGATGMTKALVLYAENLLESGKRQAVFRSPVRLNSDGAGGASERLTTGFAISDAARVCPDVEQGGLGTPLRLLNVILRGRLISQ